MEEVDDEGAEDEHESGFGEEHEDHLDPLLRRGEDHEEDDVDELDDDAGPVDGEDEGAVRVHDGQAVQHPQVTVEEGANVGYWGELLHISLFQYGDKSRPVVDGVKILTVKE